jgi:hypothetical protein
MYDTLISSVLNDPELVISGEPVYKDPLLTREDLEDSEEDAYPYNEPESYFAEEDYFSTEQQTGEDFRQEYYPDPELSDAEASGMEEPLAGYEYNSPDEENESDVENLSAMQEYETDENESVYDTLVEYPEKEEMYLTDEEAYQAETGESFFNREFDVTAEKGTTVYLNTSGVEKRNLKTGAFIPAGYRKGNQVDLVLYFHGIYPHGDKTNGIEYYWKNYSNIRACLIESQRNAILLAPTLGYNPEKTPNVFWKVNGLDTYISDCFKELKAGSYLAASAEPARIILAGHSAGGSVLRRILAGKNQLLDKVIECWGFDCFYPYGWEYLKFSVPFYHYWAFMGKCISPPGMNGENLQKSHGIINLGPKQRIGHQGIIEYAWRNEINKRSWFNPVQSNLVRETTTEEDPIGYETPPDIHVAVSPYQFKTVALPLSDRPLLLVAASERYKQSEIREAPSFFLKRIVAMALGRDAAEQWFKNFTRISFLGRELQPNQYVHVELARHLKTVESELASLYGGMNADPLIAGDFLLGAESERLAGSRAESATATYSYHMFGLAIDVNYTLSPYIQNKERKGYNERTGKYFVKPNGVNTLNEVLSHACSLLNTNQAVFKYGLSYDQYAELNKLLVSYLTLVDASNESRLSLLLTASSGPEWNGKTAEEARKKIQGDLDKLALSIDRWDYRGQLKNKGFLNISREFVNGVKLDWGGARYGDMMHFDMRNIGVGQKISKAINEYIVLKKKESLNGRNG